MYGNEVGQVGPHLPTYCFDFEICGPTSLFEVGHRWDHIARWDHILVLSWRGCALPDDHHLDQAMHLHYLLTMQTNFLLGRL